MHVETALETCRPDIFLQDFMAHPADVEKIIISQKSKI